MRRNDLRGRFKDALWYPKTDNSDTIVTIGGAGGIGSYTAFFLARAGFTPFVIDFDIIEEHNIGGQLYTSGNIGQTKVGALQTIIFNFSEVDIFTDSSKFGPEHDPVSKCMIAGFDNIAARKHMFKRWFEQYGNDPTAIYIDGRLNAEQMWIYCIRGNDVRRMDDYVSNCLPDDSTLAEEACTLKQTSHAAGMIGAQITAFFTNHIVNVSVGEEDRVVPYKWEYFLPLCLTTIKNEP